MTEGATTRATALAAAGATADALALLGAAGDAGDVNALMQLAVWRLTGQFINRDLPAARALLRRAVSIGHVDAALMEIALVANGSGGAADWGAALQLLDVAAKADPVAAAHRQLLAAMDLGPDGKPRTPPPLTRLSTAPNIWLARGFLTLAECKHIAEAALELLGPAYVIDPASGRQVAHPIRTGHHAAIGPAREDLVVRAINHRIAAVSATQTDQGESLTVLHYAVGQQYRPHVDTIAGAQNQRIKTVLLYLNEGYGGGETLFLHKKLKVAARAGDAVIFDNVLPNGQTDPTTQHAGLPVTRGTKWLATRWIRANRHDPWNHGAD